MHYLKVKKTYAERAKAFLSKNDMLTKGLKVLHGARYIYFPLTISSETNKNLPDFCEATGAVVVARAAGEDNTRSTGIRNYNEAIDMILPKNKRDGLARGYDPFGNIAVIEISDSLRSKERLIGEAIIANSSTITTVLAKSGPVKGIYRTRSVRYVAGKKTYIANYRENGCSFSFDVRRVFFSPKLSYERSRISSLVGDKENVAIPFAGVGPFAIEIAKSHKSCNVVAIELNAHAYRYMIKNIGINKVGNVVAAQGDFMDVAERFAGFADRVVMPMPKTSLDFIGAACTIAKDKAIFHIYTFCEAGKEESVISEMRKRFKGHGRDFRLVNMRVVRPYSKSDIEIVLDISASKLKHA